FVEEPEVAGGFTRQGACVSYPGVAVEVLPRGGHAHAAVDETQHGVARDTRAGFGRTDPGPGMRGPGLGSRDPGFGKRSSGIEIWEAGGPISRGSRIPDPRSPTFRERLGISNTRELALEVVV